MIGNKVIFLFLSMAIGITGGLVVAQFNDPKPQELDAQTHIGYVRSVEVPGGTYMIRFDEASWSQSASFERAALSSGDCFDDEGCERAVVENDIRWETIGLRLADGSPIIVDITGLGLEAKDGRVRPSEFARIINDQSLNWDTKPFAVTTRGDVAVEIRQYDI